MEVPALGSYRDKIFRRYMDEESKLEAKKHQMMLLLVMGAPTITDSSVRRSWNEQAKEIFSDYVNMLFGVEVSEEDRTEAQMKEFYEKVVKNMKPVIKKDSEGRLSVEGVI